MFTIVVYWGARQSFYVYTDIQMNTSFEQRMNAIRPYITEQDYLLMRSRWALMETRQDYDAIHNFIQKKAKAANIKMPRQLYE